jgi:hypothetical protein
MKLLLALLVVCLTATSAFAVIDPDPDMMGIYFDMGADDNCLNIGASIPYFAYLILTNPTPPAITAYELGLDIVVPAGMEGMLFRLASNVAGNPGFFIDKTGPLGGDYAIGLASPIPTSPATILHSWQYMLLAVMPVEMFIHSHSVPSIPGEFPIVGTIDEPFLMQVGLSTGGPNIPVATINAECVVSVEEASFGSVKAFYR